MYLENIPRYIIIRENIQINRYTSNIAHLYMLPLPPKCILPAFVAVHAFVGVPLGVAGM